MKPFLRVIIYYYVIFMVVGGVAFVYFYAKKTNSTQISSLKTDARKHYLAHRYKEAAENYKTLIDSFKLDEEAVGINYANAAFLASDLDSVSLDSKMKSGYEGIKSDSSNLKNLGGELNLLTQAEQQYQKLATAKGRTIASMANNQLGVLTLKGEGSAMEKSGTPEKLDTLLLQSIAFFREALRKNPNNDSARYNYELLKLKLDFPQTVYEQAGKLVAERRYRDAYQLLDRASRRDARMKKYEEFKNKVMAIYKIDSLKRS